jgi:hypothetical protein
MTSSVQTKAAEAPQLDLPLIDEFILGFQIMADTGTRRERVAAVMILPLLSRAKIALINGAEAIATAHVCAVADFFDQAVGRPACRT